MTHYMLFTSICKDNIQYVVDRDSIAGFYNNMYISHSVQHYLNNVITLLEKKKGQQKIISYLKELIHPYNFLYSVVVNDNKLISYSSLYYDMIDMVNNLNLFNIFSFRDIQCVYKTNDFISIIRSIHFLRNDFKDIHSTIFLSNKKYDFIYMDMINQDEPSIIENIIYKDKYDEESKTFTNRNIIDDIESFINNIALHGVGVIKINNLWCKPIIDILFLLTAMFEKVYTVKPLTSNFIKNDIYIVCKNYLNLSNKRFIVEYKSNCENIHKLVIPCSFLNKVEEFNVIIGQQQIETIDNFINLLNLNYPANNRVFTTSTSIFTKSNKKTYSPSPSYKNENENENELTEEKNIKQETTVHEKDNENENKKDVGVDYPFFYKIKYKKDKLDNLEHSNIQKCIAWCDKNNVPYKK